MLLVDWIYSAQCESITGWITNPTHSRKIDNNVCGEDVWYKRKDTSIVTTASHTTHNLQTHCYNILIMLQLYYHKLYAVSNNKKCLETNLSWLPSQLLMRNTNDSGRADNSTSPKHIRLDTVLAVDSKTVTTIKLVTDYERDFNQLRSKSNG